MTKSSPQIDSLLDPLLRISDAEELDLFLSRLIVEHVEPVVVGIIRYKLRHDNRGGSIEETEDLRQEAIAQLLIELQKLQADTEAHPIRDILGLAATITYRLCARWMRRQFPQRHALRNRIQYLLTRHAGFALWNDDKTERNKLVAGYTAWKGQKPISAADLRLLAQDEKLLNSLYGEGAAELGKALATVFNRAGGPVEFEELVKIIAESMGISGRMTDSIEADSGEGKVELADPENDIAWLVEKRIFLQRLWEELRLIPLVQRAALLLNLKDNKGNGCITLFPSTGIASIDKLAEALEMREEQLAEIWNELPLEDSRIAQLFQRSRQQIISARQSARRRLERRLEGFL